MASCRRANRRSILKVCTNEQITGATLGDCARQIVRKHGFGTECAIKVEEILTTLQNEAVIDLRNLLIIRLSREETTAIIREREVVAAREKLNRDRAASSRVGGLKGIEALTPEVRVKSPEDPEGYRKWAETSLGIA